MLSKGHRFHGYGSLKRVYQTGQTARGNVLSLKFSPRQPNKPYRVAIVVGRKVHKSAVKRNRIRRRVFETIRKSSHVPTATDLVFTVYDEKIIDLQQKELETLVDQLLEKTSK